MSRLLEIQCVAIDPVRCREVFRGGSEMVAARKMLEHLDAVHVHDGGGPSWGLSWRDASGEQQIGISPDVSVAGVRALGGEGSNRRASEGDL